jgi:hypothetical protein
MPKKRWARHTVFFLWELENEALLAAGWRKIWGIAVKNNCSEILNHNNADEAAHEKRESASR